PVGQDVDHRRDNRVILLRVHGSPPSRTDQRSLHGPVGALFTRQSLSGRAAMASLTQINPAYGKVRSWRPSGRPIDVVARSKARFAAAVGPRPPAQRLLPRCRG